MYCAMQSMLAAAYWTALSPLVHRARPRAALVCTLTVLFVFAPGYLPSGPLTLNVIASAARMCAAAGPLF
jgi:hypothetical protein